MFFLFSDKSPKAIYDRKDFGISSFYKRTSVQEWADEKGIHLDLKLQYDRYVGYLGGEPSLPTVGRKNWPCVNIDGTLTPLNFYGSLTINEKLFDLFVGVGDDTEDEEEYLVKDGLNAVLTEDSTPPWVEFKALDKNLTPKPVLKIPYIKKNNPNYRKFLESKQVKNLKAIYTLDPEALDEKYYNWGDGEDLVIFWDDVNGYYCLAPTLH